MESKIEKIEGAYDIPILKDKLNRVIDYLNSQDQEEICTHDFDLNNRCTKCGVRGVKDMIAELQDTPEEKEEWEKRFIRRFGYWGEEIKFIKQLLDEREREVRKQERMIRLHKRVSKKIDNLEEPYKSFAKAGAGII